MQKWLCLVDGGGVGVWNGLCGSADVVEERGDDRSLCANLGAANKYKIEHLLQPEQQKLIEQAQFYYIAGFFLTVCPEAALHVAKHATQNNKVPSASFCCSVSFVSVQQEWQCLVGWLKRR